MLLCLAGLGAFAKPQKVRRLPIKKFSYRTTAINNVINEYKVESITIDGKKCIVEVNEHLSNIPMNDSIVADIYDSMRVQLPDTYQKYHLSIVSRKHPIEAFVPNYLRKKSEVDKSRYLPYKTGKVALTHLSNPWQPSQGLLGRNIALWNSHGLYYDKNNDRIRWQRPALFGTVEDMLSTQIVLNYLLPMLRNAGAEVYMPRERDWHSEGVELFSTKRLNDSTTKQVSDTLIFKGNITNPDTYWVRIAYPTGCKATKLQCEVKHGGVTTKYQINTTIGGDTWLYLDPLYIKDSVEVRFYNQADTKQWDITRVYVGGGCSVLDDKLPAFVDAAVYYLRQYGAPDSILYHQKPDKDNDYYDDLYGRAKWTNYLSGGSVVNPDYPGVGIPLDLSLALHTDAGVGTTDSIIGTLVLCTSDSLSPTGYNQLTNNDFASYALKQLVSDLRATFKIEWPSRGIWHRSYVETRIPAVPSLIVELLSHQNFADMRYAHHPAFQFTVARAIYKASLRYLSEMYATGYVVQPLPITTFSALLKNDSVQLSWKPSVDKLEPTAFPTSYKVYTRKEDGSFDNGVLIKGTSCTLPIDDDVLYRFKVVAVNPGGESFPSEELSVCKVSKAKGEALIINAFDRVASPHYFVTETEAGFVHELDYGIPYHYDLSFVGEQYEFNPTKPYKTDANPGWGASRRDTAMVIQGNTFNYPYIHGKALRDNGYSFSSCSKNTIMNINNYDVVDLILGEQCDTPLFELYPNNLQQALFEYVQHKKHRLIITGAYVASSKKSDIFMQKGLRYALQQDTATQSGLLYADSQKMFYQLQMWPNSKQYFVQNVQAILPIDKNGKTLVLYTDTNLPAVIKTGKRAKIMVAGFPFESIIGDESRRYLMKLLLE
ncbi:MAG: N-acetylmuramoyl-L-alanine amidase [Paludibacteraceae bacterium]|nr:N-acetylmuramoyl-L-alanine amidase [Paludibacteraceae bacterium]